MNRDALVTKHFKQKEYVVSDWFPEIAKKIILTENNARNIYHLSSNTIEPERVESKKVTHILQGKRSKELYEALLEVGFNPSPTSKHFFKNHYDAAIDFYKKIFKPHITPKQIDIVRSRTATVRAYFWILHNCRYSFGTMYYQEPNTPNKIGFVHIDSITPDKPIGNHYIKYVGG